MNNPHEAGLYTIGHSLHSSEHFLALAREHAIDMILDVRSSPYSSRAPQFARSSMAAWLADAGIDYLFAGKTLGGRPVDLTLYDEQRASYIRMAQWQPFIASLRKAVRMARGRRVAFACAEGDPLECHRFLLIGRYLHSHGLEVRHILPSSAIEVHSAGERRLVQILGLGQSELFHHSNDAVAAAYLLQESRVAYRQPPAAPTVHNSRADAE
ncbi:MAG: DUF488 domain-containing protein [Gemmatimonadaceae bacterium]|nr:DUF488 domain-containing protein [Gemmatimonadaceae bacterium]